LLTHIVDHLQFQELKANPDREAKGTVIEASLDKARGPLATLLVQNGTLRVGDVVICGESYGKVRFTNRLAFRVFAPRAEPKYLTSLLDLQS